MKSLSVRSLVLLGSILLAGCEQATQKASAPPQPEVGVMTLRPQEATVSTTLPGRVAAYQVSEVRPQVTGILLKRLFNEGAEVKEGDPLYVIDPAQYQAAFQNAEAAVLKAQATLASVRSKAERKSQLLKTNSASQQDVDDAIAAFKQGEADLKAAEANRDAAKIALDHTVVVAPISGRIGRSTITPGALVIANQSNAMATINQINTVYVDLDQATSEMDRIRFEIANGRLKRPDSGAEIELVLENGQSYAHTGTLRFTDTNVNQTTGSISSRASFDNPDRALLPGMYVRARVIAGVKSNAILIPQRAVSRNPRGEAVAMFASPEGRVEQRILKVSQAVGQNWLVESGANEGDRVIIEGLMKVRPGLLAKTTEVAVDANTGNTMPVNPQENSKG